MEKKYRYVTRAVLASVAAVPAFVVSNAQADTIGWNTNRYSYTVYSPSYSNWGTSYNLGRVLNNLGLNYGYNYGWNNYGYNNWNNNYGYDYGYNYGYNNWNNYNGYNNLANDENYVYWNGNHYYRMNDGTYRIYRDGQWKPLTIIVIT